MRTKTDEQIIEETKWLGTVLTIEKVGDYTFISYKSKHDDEINYRGYFNDNHFSRSYESLDFAMAGTMAMVHDGVNSQAGAFFIKMITNEKNK